MKQSLLHSLGLTPKETTIYTAILKERSLSPAELAKRVGIKRTTTYSIARGLVEKGLVIEDSTRRPRVFTPSSPTDIMGIVESEKRRLVEREKILKEFSEELTQNIASIKYPVPKIRFVEEGKLEDFLYQETPTWIGVLKNLEEPVWWGFQDHTFAEQFKEWIDWHWKNTPQNVSLKLLTNRSEIEKKLAGRYPRRAMRFWEDSGNFISSTWVVEDYVIILNTRQHPFYLYEIHDALLAHDFRELFKSVWRKME
jgi:predicted transcriptional regulator